MLASPEKVDVNNSRGSLTACYVFATNSPCPLNKMTAGSHGLKRAGGKRVLLHYCCTMN